MVASSIRIITPKLEDAFLYPFFLYLLLMHKAQLLQNLLYEDSLGWMDVHTLRIGMIDNVASAISLVGWSPDLCEIIVEGGPKLCSDHVVVRSK